MGFGTVIREFGVKISLGFDPKKAKDAKKNVEDIGHAMRETGLKIAAAGAALFEMVNISSSHSRALEENSAQLGINVEKLQELQYAAKVAANVGAEELSGALEGMSKTLFEARNGNVEAAQSFIRMGVSLDAIRNPAVTADQIMETLADRFKTMPDGIYKTALANNVGGASMAKLLPLLNKGSEGMAAYGREARATGLVLSHQAVEAGAAFDRQMTKVWLQLKNVTYLLGNQLMKYLGPIVQQFLHWVTVNRQFIATGIAGVMKAVGMYLNIIFTVLRFVIERFKTLVDVLGGVEKVAKYIAIAMGAITGLRILSGMGTLISSFRAMSGVMGGISAQSLAISAGLIALLLVVQDLFSDDSVIKEWFAKFKAEFPNLAAAAEALGEGMVAVVNRIADGWKNLYSWVHPILTAIDDFLGKHKSDFEALAMGGSNVGQPAKAGPSSMADALFGDSGGGSTTNMTVNTVVQVPTGTGAGAAADMVETGTTDAFDSMLRSTRNQSIGGRKY